MKYQHSIGGKVSRTLSTPATQADHVPQFGQIPTKEHQLPGNRITASITGTYAIDWNAGSQFILTPTGAVTLSDANLPVAPNTKVISGRFTASANTVTFPASWKAAKNNDPLSATLDTHFTAETYPTYVLYTLENIPA